MSESLAVAGSVIEVVLPPDNVYAKVQADLAAAYAAQASVAANVASAAAAGRIYASYALGSAATTAGQYFFVAAGGAYDLYVNGNATPVAKLPTLDAATGNLGAGVAPLVKLHLKSSGGMVRLETTNARGTGSCFESFYDPNGEKGFVGYAGGNDDLYLYNSLAARLIFGVSNLSVWQILSSGNLGPVADNAYNLAAAGDRIANSFFAVSPTVTSDEREKTWRGAMTDAELRAAKRIGTELGFYQWNDTIAEKGADGARLHFGVRAQQVWAIMADEGLIDPLVESVTPDCKYAFLCWDAWDAIAPAAAVDEVKDDDGNIVVGSRPAQPGREASDRFGIRADQLTMFLIAAQEARLAAIEAAL